MISFDERRLRWFFLAGLAALTLGACHNYYAEGLEALKSGKLDRAEEEAREGVKDDPSDPDLRLLLAKVLVEKEEYAKARWHARRAVRKLKKNPEAHTVFARIQLELGAPISAADYYLKARDLKASSISKEKERLKNLLPLAVDTALEYNFPEKAERFVLALQEIDPSHEKASEDSLRLAREAIGQKLTRDGQYQEAADHYATLYETYPDRDTYLLEQATLLLLLDRDKNAEALFEKYANLGDDKAKRSDLVATRANIRGRRAVAQKWWERSAELDPSQSDVHFKLAGLHLSQNKPDDAFKSLQDGIKAGGGKPALYIQAAAVAEERSRGDLAIEILTMGNREAEPDFNIARQLADLHLRRERRGEMEDALKVFIDRTPEAKRAKAMLDAVDWLEARREYDVAAHYLGIVLQGQDAPAEAWLRFARLEGSRRRFAEMIEAVEKYIKASDKNAVNYRKGANVLSAANLHDEAVETLKQGLKQHPGDASILQLMARTYEKLGELGREKETYLLWVKTQKEPASAALTIGQTYARRGDLDRAKPFLDIASKSPKHAPRAQLIYGELYQNLGMDKEMRAAFDAYLKLSPNREQALMDLLRRLKGRDQSAEAVRILKTLIGLRPKDASLQFEMAGKLLFLGDTDGAMTALNAYVALSKDKISATRKAGRVLTQRGHMALTLSLYEAFIASEDDNPEMLGEIGELYWELSRRYSSVMPSRAQLFEDAARDYYLRFIDGYTKNQPSRREARLLPIASKLVKRKHFALAARAYQRAEELKLRLGTNDHFTKGEALLGIGDHKGAESSFARHLRKASEGSRRLKVGETCYRAEAYGCAEKYLESVIDKGVKNQATSAFTLLSKIYIQTDRKKMIEPLAEKTLSVMRRSFGIRHTIAQVYLEAGLWEKAASEYQELIANQPDNADLVLKLAQALYISGDEDAARKTFADAARSTSNPARTWETVGNFYLVRGELAQAFAALSKAVEAGASSADIKVQRGLLLMLQGKFSQGQAEIDAALAMPVDHEDHYALIAGALDASPRRDLALAFAAEASNKSRNPREHLIRVIQNALERGNIARALREANRPAMARNGEGALINLLLQNGYSLEGLEKMRVSFLAGNVESISNAITGNINMLDEGVRTSTLGTILDYGGAQRLPMYIRPLLIHNSANKAAIHAGIGNLYTGLEDYDRATVHLSAATKDGNPRALLTLAQIHLLDGEKDKARGIFARYAQHNGANPALLLQAVREVVRIYIAHSELHEAERFTRAIMAQPGRDGLMVPVLVHVLLLDQRREEALDILRAGPFEALFEDQGGPTPLAAARISDLIEATNVLAGHGFGKEAVSLLTTVAELHTDHEGLLLALIEHSARMGAADTETWSQAYLKAGSDKAADLGPHKLRLAEALNRGGDTAAARTLLMTLVGNHDATMAKLSLRHLISMAWQSADDKALVALLDAHQDGRANTFEALLDEGQLLRGYGFYARAAAAYAAAVTLSPTASGAWRSLLDSRVMAGVDVDELLATEKRASAMRRTTHADQVRFGNQLTQGPDSDAAAAWWDALAEDAPTSAPRLIGVAAVAYLQDDAAAGRSALDNLLKMSNKDPVMLARVQHLLTQLQRWDDLLSLTRDHGPAALMPNQARRGALPPLPPRSYLFMGLAHYAKGQRAEALNNFDAFTKLSSDPLGTNIAVSQAILRARPGSATNQAVFKDGLIYVERALQDNPDAPMPYLQRGILRLKLGQTDAAMTDFDTHLEKGSLSHLGSLDKIGRALLREGETNRAEPYLLRLTRHPSMSGGAGISMALRAFEDAGRFNEGLAFFQAHFPVLALNPHTNIDVLFANAELLAGAGDIDRAAQLYEQGMVRFPNSNLLANNLAYLLARTGKDLDRAEKLVRTALGSRQLQATTQGAYLDTLAWILRKKGDLAQARDTQLRALRLIQGQHQSAVVLYTHLADIYDGLGDSAKASEARYRAKLHDPDASAIPLSF